MYQTIFKYQFKTIPYLYFIVIFFCSSQRILGQWERTSSIQGNDVSKIISHNHILYALTDSGASISNDLGLSWELQNWGLGFRTLHFIDDVMIGSTAAGVYLTSDFGKSWNLINNIFLSIYKFTSNSSYLFSGSGYDVYRSADSGATWSASKLNTTGIIRSMIATDSIVLLGTSGWFWDTPIGRVYSSNNNGVTWNEVYQGSPVTSLTICKNYLYAGLDQEWSNRNLFRTSDNGSHWLSLYSVENNLRVISLCSNENNVFIGTQGKGVYRITNDDSIMTSVDSGLLDTARNVQCMTILDGYLFIGTGGKGVWRRPLSEITTSVEFASVYTPDHYSLSQNYPNPFNPSTTINYSIPEQSNVTIIIFDALGREVANLVNEEKQPGSYEVEFGSSVGSQQLASGIYFYQLRAGEFIQTKKMLLLR